MAEGILIVSGGILQIPALEKARTLGLTTYLTDGSDHCKARAHADHFLKVDIRDIDGHAKLAKQLVAEKKISAVYTQGADVEYTVAYAAQAAGLPGLSVEAALNCHNKLRTRTVLHAARIDHTPFAAVRSYEDLENAIKKIGFPSYLKPLDNSASRGLTRLTEGTPLRAAYDRAVAASLYTKDLILEAEIEGHEYSVDSVVVDDVLYPAGVSDRQFLKKNKYAVQSGSTTPSLLPQKTQDEMYALMGRAAKALGVSTGAFKGDLVVTPQGEVRIIELAGRTSGGFDSQYRKPYSYGIDILKITMDLARGIRANLDDLRPKWTKWSRTFSVFPEPGVVKSIEGLDEILRLPGVRNAFILVKPGDKIAPTSDCAERTNHIIISADSLDELNGLQNRVTETLRIITC
jgi:biotin carboxylase